MTQATSNADRAVNAGISYAVELAARAAGLKEHGWIGPSYCHVVGKQKDVWLPHCRPTEALLLAAKLSIDLKFEGNSVLAFVPKYWYPDDAQFRCTERYERAEDIAPAMCRAVVFAAALIAKAMLTQKGKT